MISSCANAGKVVPTLTAKNIGFGSRSDEREKPRLIHPCQPNIYRALMRVNFVPAFKLEKKEKVRRTDTRVTAVPAHFFDVEHSPCCVGTRCATVSTSNPENIFPNNNIPN